MHTITRQLESEAEKMNEKFLNLFLVLSIVIMSLVAPVSVYAKTHDYGERTIYVHQKKTAHIGNKVLYKAMV